MRNKALGLTAHVVGLVLCVPLLVHAQTVSKILGRDSVSVADVLPANTAPVASNRALVVTLSPNSSSPVGTQDVNLEKVGGVAVALGQAFMAASIPVAIASNQSPLTITGTVVTSPPSAGTTSTTTAVDCSAASTLFASNASAVGRKIYNRSANGTLRVLYGSGTLTGESDSSFSVQPGQTWEMPNFSGIVEYTGAIKCLLVSGQFVQTTEVQ